MQFIAALKLALTLMPILIDLIKQVEALFPSGGQGQQKLNMVKNLLQSAYAVGNDLGISFDQMWAAAQPLVAAAVAIYNADGTFKKP